QREIKHVPESHVPHRRTRQDSQNIPDGKARPAPAGDLGRAERQALNIPRPVLPDWKPHFHFIKTVEREARGRSSSDTAQGADAASTSSLRARDLSLNTENRCQGTGRLVRGLMEA